MRAFVPRRDRRANHVLTVGSGRTMTAAAATGLIPARAWQRVRTGSGTKGTRHYDWAMLEVASDDTPAGFGDGRSVLLARRHRYTGTLSYYGCWAPGPVPLPRLIAIATVRWWIEEDHQLAKQAAGLDAGQVIRWTSWHRWTAICLLAYIYLAVAVAVQRRQDAGSDLDAGLIPVTVPELLRLLRDIVIPPPGETVPTGCTGRPGGAATSTVPGKPTGAGTPTPRRHRDYNLTSATSQAQQQQKLDRAASYECASQLG